MDALRTHVAGVDVHKDVLAITVLRGEPDAKPEEIQFTSDTFTEDLMKTGTKLLDLGIREVAMESTGIYWKPLDNVWTPMGLRLTVGQAAHMKNVPGRKTDMNDSQWIAHLHRYGLIKPSMIPEDTFQKIRLLTRHRESLVRDLAKVKNRIQMTLEDGNVKWGSIVSDVFGKSGLSILEAIAKGVTNAGDLALLVKTGIKRKDEAKKALTNCLSSEHVFLIKTMMTQYTHLENQLKEIDGRLENLFRPYEHLLEELDKVPGIDKILAQRILAESTDKMENFPDERAYAAWSGVASGNNESAGKKKIKMSPGKSPSQKSIDPSSTWSGENEENILQEQVQQIEIQTGFKKQSEGGGGQQDRPVGLQNSGWGELQGTRLQEGGGHGEEN